MTQLLALLYAEKRSTEASFTSKNYHSNTAKYRAILELIHILETEPTKLSLPEGRVCQEKGNTLTTS